MTPARRPKKKNDFVLFFFLHRFLFCTNFHFSPFPSFSCQLQSLCCDSFYCKPTELLARVSWCCEGFDKRHICVWISFGAESHHCGTGTLALLVLVKRRKTFLPAPRESNGGTKGPPPPFLPSQGPRGMRPENVVWMAGSGSVVSLRRPCMLALSSFTFFLFILILSFFLFLPFPFLSFFVAVPSLPSIFDVLTLKLLRKLLLNRFFSFTASSPMLACEVLSRHFFCPSMRKVGTCAFKRPQQRCRFCTVIVTFVRAFVWKLLFSIFTQDSREARWRHWPVGLG